VINSMKNIKKIYMQFPDDFVNNAIQRIKAVLGREIDIIPITDTNEFYIPHEYD
jgi:hypothetical protein